LAAADDDDSTPTVARVCAQFPSRTQTSAVPNPDTWTRITAAACEPTQPGERRLEQPISKVCLFCGPHQEPTRGNSRHATFAFRTKPRPQNDSTKCRLGPPQTPLPQTPLPGTACTPRPAGPLSLLLHQPSGPRQPTGVTVARRRQQPAERRRPVAAGWPPGPRKRLSRHPAKRQ
jgi:hypothetical protein